MCKCFGSISQLETRPLIGWPWPSESTNQWPGFQLTYASKTLAHDPALNHIPNLKVGSNRKIMALFVRFFPTKRFSVKSWQLFEFCFYVDGQRVKIRRNVGVILKLVIVKFSWKYKQIVILLLKNVHILIWNWMSICPPKIILKKNMLQLV